VAGDVSDLRRADGTPYVGKTTMLDLERACAAQDAPRDAGGGPE